MQKEWVKIKMRLKFLEWLEFQRNDQFVKLCDEFLSELMEELHNDQ